MAVRLIFYTTMVFLLAACGASSTLQPTHAPVAEATTTLVPAENTAINTALAETTQETIAAEDHTATSTGELISRNAALSNNITQAGDVYQGPAWTQIELTNARSGETFSLADFAGKVVFVEPMATWCTDCTVQERQMAAARQRLNNEDVVFMSLSIEFIDDAQLAQYADDNGFEFLFAVANEQILSALIGQFGRTVTVAPATPHFTIAPDGTISGLRTGQPDSEAIIAEVTNLLN